MAMLLSLFVAVSVSAGTIQYTYDNAGRLTGADYGAGKTIQFTYDNNGNLLTRKVEAPATQYTMAVNADPVAGGTVTGGGTYDKDEQVTVEATANANYSFVNWTEGGAEVSTTAQYTFTATADRTLAANFTENRRYTLTVSVSSANRGSVTGKGIDCPGDCTHDYDENTAVQLTAAPTAGNKFLRWKGALTGATNPDTLTMNADKQVAVYFGFVTNNTDTDGVPDGTESGPNGNDPAYDGNNNGVPDYQEAGAASLPSASGGAYVTIAVANGSGQVLSDVQAQGNPSPQDAPERVEFPFGFFTFAINNLANPGDPATATLYLPRNTAIDTYYQYGPTPDDPTDHWYEFMYNGDTGAEIFHEAAQTRIVLHFRDGARGDKDLSANGRIDDPGAPGALSALSASPIPTLTEWGAIILALLLVGIAMVRMRRPQSAI